jgi:mannose-6-phosphate isomerase-like protein (cupin superfamily)
VQHTHEHDHLFVVVSGRAKVMLGEELQIVEQNSSVLVKGSIPHSVWNGTDGTTVMLGISLED